MYDNLARRAILAALANDWESALEANLAILASEENDKDALNRAAKAYLQLGDVKNATEFAQKVIDIDPLNPIAQKCFAKCVAFEGDGINTTKSVPISHDMFLEIPGKTRIVSLVNLSESQTLARLDAGENVHLMPKTHRVVVTTAEEVYIGRLPDDLAVRIIHFHKNGNEYDSRVKSVADDKVEIFIRETKRADSLAHIPSFPMR